MQETVKCFYYVLGKEHLGVLWGNYPRKTYHHLLNAHASASCRPDIEKRSKIAIQSLFPSLYSPTTLPCLSATLPTTIFYNQEKRTCKSRKTMLPKFLVLARSPYLLYPKPKGALSDTLPMRGT